MRSLDLSRTATSGAELAALARHAELATLKLDKTNVTDANSAPLADLERLEELSLANTEAGDDTLERIAKQSLDGVEVHEARLVTAQKDAVELYAVGKTGNLVKRKPAKFCGVITGAEREGRAIVAFAVGMFDTNK